MSTSESSKLIVPYLNHIYQPRFELLVMMLNISLIPKKYIWWSSSFKNTATLDTVTSVIVNLVQIFLQMLQHLITDFWSMMGEERPQCFDTFIYSSRYIP